MNLSLKKGEARVADLKDIYSKKKISEIGSHFKEVADDFPVDQFESLVFSDEWSDMTLRQRHVHLAQAVYTCLQRPFKEVGEILRQVNGRAKGFSYLFLPDIVALYGMEEMEAALETLEVLTTGSSAEFAIRPFLEKDFEAIFLQMKRWANSSNEHHRRLASEGLRPNLPWGKKVASIGCHRQEIFTLLEWLKSDPSLYVRKSVANHLNDWTKTHPNEVLNLLARWQGTSKETDWIIKRAARSLLKGGSFEALSLLGYNMVKLSQVDLTLSSDHVHQGEMLTIMYALNINSNQEASKVRLDLQLGFVKKKGACSFKTFILKDLALNIQDKIEGKWSYHWLDKSTRKHYDGKHILRLVVNGQVVKETAVQVSGFNER